MGVANIELSLSLYLSLTLSISLSISLYISLSLSHSLSPSLYISLSHSLSLSLSLSLFLSLPLSDSLPISQYAITRVGSNTSQYNVFCFCFSILICDNMWNAIWYKRLAACSPPTVHRLTSSIHAVLRLLCLYLSLCHSHNQPFNSSLPVLIFAKLPFFQLFKTDTYDHGDREERLAK